MRRREYAWVAMLASVLTILWTWPLAPSLGSRIVCDPLASSSLESLAHLRTWNFWWVGQAFETGQSPFFCDRIAWPDGAGLAWRPNGFLWAALALPFQRCWGALAAANLSWLASWVVGCLAVYRLSRGLGLRPAAASCALVMGVFWLGGSRSGAGHWGLFADPWPALVWLALGAWLRSAREGGSLQSLVTAAIAGAVLGLSWLSSSAALLPSIFGAGLFLALSPRPDAPAGARRLRSSQLPAGSWLMIPLASVLVSLPLLNALATQRGDWSAGSPAGGGLVGIKAVTLLGLALFGCRSGAAARRWFLIGVASGLMALDPGSLITRIGAGLGSWNGLYVREAFASWAVLPLALSAALGLERLARAFRPARAVELAAPVLALAGLLPCWRTAQLSIPAAVQAMARSGSSGTVAFLPLAAGAHASQTWQSIHRQPVLGSPAGLSRSRADRWRATASDLFAAALGRDGASPLGLEIDLERHGVRHVLMRAGDEATVRLSGVLDRMNLWERAEGDEQLQWWRLLAEQATVLESR